MSDRLWFLQMLRQYNPEGYLYILSVSPAGRAKQLFVKDDLDGALLTIEQLAPKNNIFVGISSYSEPKATKEYVTPGRLVWVDHDGPDAMPSMWEPAPSIAWRTSEGRYQALWVLDTPLPKERIEAKCAELARRFGADMSGRDCTQVLRLPGTLNQKHAPPTPVSYLWKRDALHYTPEQIPEDTPATAPDTAPPHGEDAPDKASRDMALYLLGRYQISTAVIAECFLNEQVDRSAALYKLMAQLFEKGASAPDVYRIIDHSSNQKFDTPLRLWEDVNRARIRVPPKAGGWVLHHASELADVSDDVGWIINPFLYSDCVGTVVGEPSARKSWNTLDLSVAVCCEEVNAFHDQPVLDHGPVIYFFIDDQRERRLKLRLQNIVEARTGERKLDIPLWWVNSGLNYNDEQWSKYMAENLERVEDITGERVRLVVIDTLHRAGFNPKDWGINAQVFLDGLNTMATAKNTAFMIVHHTTKNAGPEQTNVRTAPWGSTFTGASLDPTWRLTRDYKEDRDDPERMHVMLEVWSKEGPEMEPIMLAYGKDPTKFEVVVQQADVGTRILRELERAGEPVGITDLIKRMGVVEDVVRRTLQTLEGENKIESYKTGNRRFISLPTEEEAEF